MSSFAQLHLSRSCPCSDFINNKFYWNTENYADRTLNQAKHRLNKGAQVKYKFFWRRLSVILSKTVQRITLKLFIEPGWNNQCSYIWQMLRLYKQMNYCKMLKMILIGIRIRLNNGWTKAYQEWTKTYLRWTETGK